MNQIRSPTFNETFMYYYSNETSTINNITSSSNLSTNNNYDDDDDNQFTNNSFFGYNFSTFYNIYSGDGTGRLPKPVIIEWNSVKLLLTLYSIIFLLATIGNSLVILTLVQNKRMRTITNVFLLNLAISDLFLGVFCMPFTLVGSILRNFIFGEIMCKLLPYLQGMYLIKL